MNIGNAVNVSESESGYFLNGGSKELAVNGAITPVLFTVDIPNDGKDYAVTGLNMTFNSNTSIDSGQAFMDLPALANGIAYGFIRRSDGLLVPVRGPIKTNMDMFARDSNAGQFNMAGNDEIVSIDGATGLPLVANSSFADRVYIQINDDLTGLISGEGYLKIYRVIPSRR